MTFYVNLGEKGLKFDNLKFREPLKKVFIINELKKN